MKNDISPIWSRPKAIALHIDYFYIKRQCLLSSGFSEERSIFNKLVAERYKVDMLNHTELYILAQW